MGGWIFWGGVVSWASVSPPPFLRLRSGLLAGAKPVPALPRRGILGLSLIMVGGAAGGRRKLKQPASREKWNFAVFGLKPGLSGHFRERTTLESLENF